VRWVRSREGKEKKMFTRTVKQAVNRFAHAQGMRHSEIVKQRVLAALEAMRADGSTQAELLQHVEGIAATPEEKEPT
jgi:hypothetical protein